MTNLCIPAQGFRQAVKADAALKGQLGSQLCFSAAGSACCTLCCIAVRRGDKQRPLQRPAMGPGARQCICCRDADSLGFRGCLLDARSQELWVYRRLVVLCT